MSGRSKSKSPVPCQGTQSDHDSQSEHTMVMRHWYDNALTRCSLFRCVARQDKCVEQPLIIGLVPWPV